MERVGGYSEDTPVLQRRYARYCSTLSEYYCSTVEDGTVQNLVNQNQRVV